MALLGSWLLFGQRSEADPSTPAAHLVFTEPTANDSAVKLPSEVDDLLRSLGRAERTIALTRIAPGGTPATSIVDLTPRISEDPNSDVLRVPDRIEAALTAKISQIEVDLNTSTAATGGRSLLAGLTKLSFTEDIPLVFISSGLDLSDPLDFRKLGFDVAATTLTDQLRKASELPELPHVSITFVLVPVTGRQELLRTRQTAYVKDLWRKLLLAAGAAEVRYVVPAPRAPESTVAAPVVEIPPPPNTPQLPRTPPDKPKMSICNLTAAAYFQPDSSDLVDPQSARQMVAGCVKGIGPATTVTVEGWTASTEPLGPGGNPVNTPVARALSKQRAQAIADLLIAIGVPSTAITAVIGHGTANQPDPDPRSAGNRIVRITITSK